MISKKSFFITCLLVAGLAAGWNVSQSVSGDAPTPAEAEMIRAIPPDEDGWAEDELNVPEDVPSYQGEEKPTSPVQHSPADKQDMPVPQAP